MKPLPQHTIKETVDTLFGGRLAIIQSKAGYRFSLDAILLAHFVEVCEGDRIADLGTGNGVIPIILASLHPCVSVVGVEVQQAMVARALRSVAWNGLGDRVEITQADVRSPERVSGPKSFDVAVCNPPYRRLASGRINPDPEKRVARHEIQGSLRDFLRAGSYLLRRKGRMALVYPATRAIDLFSLMRQEGIEPRLLRWVHSFEGDPATLVLVEGVKGAGGELKVMPPLVVYSRDGRYVAEVEAILRK